MSLARVALGTACGALARQALSQLIPHEQGAFPIATLTANVTGCLLIGWLEARFETGAWIDRRETRSFWLTGVCGGYTTFSLFAWETASGLQAGGAAATYAIAYVVLTVGLSLPAVTLGRRLSTLSIHRLHALKKCQKDAGTVAMKVPKDGPACATHPSPTVSPETRN